MKTPVYLALIILCFCASKNFAQTGNNCSSAIDLSTLTSPFQGTTTGYSNDFDQSCVSIAVDRVFYIDVLNGQTIIMQQIANSYDSRNSVTYGDNCPGQNAIACWDDPDTNLVSWANNTGETQRVWWVQDAYNSSGSGDFTLSWNILVAPENDFCANAIAIGCNQPITGTTLSASPDELPPCSYGLSSTFGVWYEIEGNGNVITLDLCNSDFDTQLGVFAGDCSNLTCIALDDDSSCGLSSRIEFNSLLGTNYYILVTGYNSNIGNYELTVDCEVSFVNDLAVTQLISPVDSCAYQELQQVQVEIKNEGTISVWFSIGLYNKWCPIYGYLLRNYSTGRISSICFSTGGKYGCNWSI